MEANLLCPEDTINCGRCGLSFQSFEDYKSHKLVPCHSAASNTLSTDAAPLASLSLPASHAPVPASLPTPTALASSLHLDSSSFHSSILSAAGTLVAADPAATIDALNVQTVSPTQPTQQQSQVFSLFQQQPQPQQPPQSVIYLNNFIGDHSLLNSLIGALTPESVVSNAIGIQPSIEIVASSADSLHQQQLWQRLQPAQQPQSVSQQLTVDAETHLSALIDVNNGLFASHDLDIAVTTDGRRIFVPGLASSQIVDVDDSGPSKRRNDDEVIAVIDANISTPFLVDASKGAGIMIEKTRNKTAILPAKTPVNLPESSSPAATSEKRSSPLLRSRRRGGGATVTQTQTTRVFKLSCPFCQKLFCKKFDLEAHARVHTGEKPFQCCICGKCFAQKSNVKKHLSTHKAWPEARTSLPKRFGAISGSNGSESSLENFISSYFCQFCDDKFDHWTKLSSHLAAVHKDRRVFKCRVMTCPETFSEAVDLMVHLNRSHDPSEIKYRCDECCIEFSTLGELGLHQFVHATVVIGEENGAAVTGKEGVGTGLSATPKPDSAARKSSARYVCSQCGEKFAKEETLTAHLKSTTHSFPCPFCVATSGEDGDEMAEISNSSLVFVSERLLRKHFKECHASSSTSRRRLVCSHCAKSFKTKALLNAHVKSHGPSIHECEDPRCGRKFKRKDQLTRHRKTVHGESHFRCPFKTICSKKYGRRDQLRLHVRHVHENVANRRPWKCDRCGKAFLSRHHLAEHESTHGDNRRFRCGNCDRGFLRQSQLKNHSCDTGDKWRRKEVDRTMMKGKENDKDDNNEASWRKSTLLRSGRKTRPTKKLDDVALDELDAAFQPLEG